MKRALALLLVLLLLTGCVPQFEKDEGTLLVAASTYPLACLAVSILGNTPGVQVETVVNQPSGCLHDYTLTISDARVLSEADLILLNGGGLEDFMNDALSALPGRVPVVDCSVDLDLLGGDEGLDPHLWMDPLAMADMAQSVAAALASLLPAYADDFYRNAEAVQAQLRENTLRWQEDLSGMKYRELITFHDGFSYLAGRFDLTILAAIEEEEGSEASAKQMAEIIGLVKDNQIPCIFTEVNGSQRSAQAIARETPAKVGTLSLIMSGDAPCIEAYIAAMDANVTALREGLS